MRAEFVQTECEDGLILQGLFCSPDKPTDKVILHFHGMGENFYEQPFIKTMMKEYPNNGFTFLTVEQRGSEIIRYFKKRENDKIISKRIGDAFEIFEESQYDIKAWVSFLEKKGYKEIHIQSHSLTPTKVVYYRNLHKQTIKSLIFLAPADMYGLRHSPNLYSEHKELLSEAERLVSEGKGKTFLSKLVWGEYLLSADTYVNFFGEGNNLSIFNYFKPELGFELISKIDIPILAIIGSKDDSIVTDHEQSMKMLGEKATNCPKYDYLVIEGSEHDFKEFEKVVTDKVLEFIEKLK